MSQPAVRSSTVRFTTSPSWVRMRWIPPIGRGRRACSLGKLGNESGAAPYRLDFALTRWVDSGSSTSRSLLPRLHRVAYARVFSADQKADLARQKLRLLDYACVHGWVLHAVIAVVGSGLNASRRELLKTLADPSLGWLIVEHRDQLARFGFDMVDALLRAWGGGVVVLEEKEVDDDLVRDMTEVLTSMCARLYGRRSARRRARKAVEAAAA